MLYTKPTFSVIVPYHQESRDKLARDIKMVFEIFDKHQFEMELLVVDDSGECLLQDEFPEYDQLRLITNRYNMGKGASIRKAVLEAKKKVVLYTDCDFPVDLDHFLSEYQKYEPFDLLIGNRRQGNRNPDFQETSLSRKVMSRLFSGYVYMISAGKLYDTQCPLKVIKRPYAEKLFSELTIKGYAFDFEVLTKALKEHYRLVRVAVNYSDGRRKMAWGEAIEHTFKMIRDVSSYRFSRNSPVDIGGG